MTYDESGNLIRRISKAWNVNVDSLTVIRQIDYSYDVNSNLNEEIKWQQHSSRGWEKTDSIIWKYSEDGLIQSRTRYIQVAIGVIGLFEQDFYNYTNDGVLLSKVEYGLYVIEFNEFFNIYITEYEYDYLGKPILSFTYDSIRGRDARDLITELRYQHNEDINSENVLLPRNNVWFSSRLLDNSTINPLIKYCLLYTSPSPRD